MDGGSFSVWHVLIFLIGFLIVVVPYVKIIQKAGYSGWWVIVGFIPVVNLIMLWVFAWRAGRSRIGAQEWAQKRYSDRPPRRGGACRRVWSRW